MKKYSLALMMILGVCFTTYGQKYRTAIGPRIESDMFGISIQQKIQERSTLEGIVAVGAREFSGTLLFEWHRPLLGERFNYYFGGGGHVGNLKDKGVFTGGDVILGVEYKVNGLPFLISADVKPAFHINHENWINLSSGISVRYVIVKEKPKKRSIWPFGKNKNDEEKFDILKIFKKPDNQ